MKITESSSTPSNKAEGGSAPSSDISLSTPELGSGRLFDPTQQREIYSSHTSNGPPRFTDSSSELGGALTVQGGSMPGFQAHAMHNFEMRAIPPSGFQETPVDVRAPWEQSGGFTSSSRSSMIGTDGGFKPYSYRMPGLTVSSGDFASFPSSDFVMPWPGPYGKIEEAEQSEHVLSNIGYQPAALQEPQSAEAATYSPLDVNRATTQITAGGSHPADLCTPVMPLGQRHPFPFQTQLPVSVTPLPTQQQFPTLLYSAPSSY